MAGLAANTSPFHPPSDDYRACIEAPDLIVYVRTNDYGRRVLSYDYYVVGRNVEVQRWVQECTDEYPPGGYGTNHTVVATDDASGQMAVHVWRAASCD
jgi:hypothetical protein